MEERLRTLISLGVSRAVFDSKTGRITKVEFANVEPGAIADYVTEQVLERISQELGEDAKVSLGLRLSEKSLMGL